MAPTDCDDRLPRWADPAYEEFQCEGCFCPDFRPVNRRGPKQRYCDATCSNQATFRRKKERDATQVDR